MRPSPPDGPGAAASSAAAAAAAVEPTGGPAAPPPAAASAAGAACNTAPVAAEEGWAPSLGAAGGAALRVLLRGLAEGGASPGPASACALRGSAAEPGGGDAARGARFLRAGEAAAGAAAGGSSCHAACGVVCGGSPCALLSGRLSPASLLAPSPPLLPGWHLTITCSEPQATTPTANNRGDFSREVCCLGGPPWLPGAATHGPPTTPHHRVCRWCRPLVLIPLARERAEEGFYTAVPRPRHCAAAGSAAAVAVGGSQGPSADRERAV